MPEAIDDCEILNRPLTQDTALGKALIALVESLPVNKDPIYVGAVVTIKLPQLAYERVCLKLGCAMDTDRIKLGIKNCEVHISANRETAVTFCLVSHDDRH
jgi:hypothetical protein